MRGAASRNGQGETAIDPWRDVKLRPFPSTQNVIMPFYRTGSHQLATGSGATAVKNLGFRLNSIWDVYIEASYSADPTPAADTPEAAGSDDCPAMRDFWANIYRYWTVLSSHYKVRFWTNNATDQEVEIWVYHHGQQTPPLVTTDGTPQKISKLYRKMHPHCHHEVLRGHSASATEKDLFKRSIEITGNYRKGNYTVHNVVS